MKHIFFLLLSFSFCSGIIAQTTYESPHVKDGKTIQLTIPNGFYFVEDASYAGNAMYCSKKDLNYAAIEEEAKNNAILGILHEPVANQTMVEFAEELKSDMAEMGENTTFIQEPTIVDLKGRKCLIAGIKGEVDGEMVKGIYLGAITFGDYVIVLGYYAREGVSSVMSFEDFKKTLGTWKEIATTKEDGLSDFMDLMDIEIGYLNDLFETDLTYYDILPDPVEEWDEPYEENSHLLCEYAYNGDGGSIKIFSGGATSNYPTDKEKASAIQQVMELNQPITLTYDSQFSNEDHFFKLYSIKGGGTMTSVYTTIVNSELVFFIVDGGESEDVNFKPAVRDFMLTMWIDYFDEEGEE